MTKDGGFPGKGEKIGKTILLPLCAHLPPVKIKALQGAGRDTCREEGVLSRVLDQTRVSQACDGGSRHGLFGSHNRVKCSQTDQVRFRAVIVRAGDDAFVYGQLGIAGKDGGRSVGTVFVRTLYEGG